MADAATSFVPDTSDTSSFVPDAPDTSSFVPDGPSENPDTSALKSYVQKNIQDHFAPGETDASKIASQEKKVQAHTAEGFFEALQAGYQGSAWGLSSRLKMPDQVLPEHASTALKIAEQIGGLADLPLMLGSGMVASGMGPLAGAAAAFTVPAVVRKILADHFEKGDIMDTQEFATRVMSTSWEAIKAATTGVATELTGGAAKAIAGPITQKVAELAAMTTTSAALEGHLPKLSDFVAGSVVIGGLHGAGVLRGKLGNVYAATGETPEQVYNRSQQDVNLKQDLIAGNLNEPIPPVKIGENNELVSNPVTPERLQHFSVADGTIDNKKVQPGDTAPKPGDTTEARTKAGLPELTDDEKNTLSHVGESAEVPNPTLKENWQSWYQNKIDKFAPMKWAIQEAEARGAKINPQDNAYKGAGRFEAHQDVVGSFYEHGTWDWNTGKVNGEGLNKIYGDIPDNDIERFRAFAMNKRALEVHEAGMTPWKDFDPEAAKRVVDNGEDLYGKINERRVEFKNKTLKFVKDSGLIDDDAEKRMVKANKQAFPFHRVQEPDVFDGKKTGGAILKRFYGSDKLILDPILSDYQDTALMIKKAMVNGVRQDFHKNMTEGGLVDESPKGSDPNPDAYLRRVPTDMKATVVGSDELSKALEKQGLDLTPDDIKIFRPEMGVLKENQVAFKIDGKRVVYEGPQGVIDSLKALDGDSSATSTWVKVMAGFAKMERIGTTSNPAFGLSHFFRAGVMSGVYTKTGQIPFWDAAGVIGDITGKSELYRDAEYHGAFAKVFEPINEQFMQKSIESAGIKTDFQSKAWNVVKHPLDAAEAWIRLTDSASRLAEYKRAVEQGKSPEEAASLAREVVVDYQKIGLQKSAIRQSTAFLGVHINSMDRLRLAFAEDPKSTIAKLAVVSGISAALWAVNKDDEAIQSTTDWQKALFWQINLSRTNAAITNGTYNPKEAYILRLPKPWAAGIAFGTGMEVGLDTLFKNNQNEGEHFARTLIGSVVPLVPVPNMVLPGIEHALNQTLSTGKPLVSEEKQKQLPDLRCETYTSETAKQLSKLIGYVPLVHDIGPPGGKASLDSPTVVENYVKNWTGSTGGLVLKILDTGLRAVGVGNQKTLPDSNVSEWPFFDSFVSRYPSMKSQNLQNFYENKTETDRVFKSIKAYEQKGDAASIRILLKSDPDLMFNLDEIGQGIATAKQALTDIQFQTNIPSVQKRQLMDTVTFQIMTMAKQGNKAMSDFQKIVREKGK